jgi:DNA-binding GntR family transcriptional regulator
MNLPDTLIKGPGRSRHALIAEALADRIHRSQYKVGDLLPSESELSTAFGVSRHTVRAALQTLHSLGLVASQQGVGTEVRRQRAASRYTHSFDSASDLLQYANSKRRVLGEERIVVNEAQTRFLGCRLGEHWLRVTTLRYDEADGSPATYSEILIPATFEALVPELGKSRTPLFALIEKRFNESVTEIAQDIRAISMSSDVAQWMGVRDGSPGLEITRRFLGKGRRVLEVARSVHRPDVFRYSMNIQLQHELGA